jgi:hypothetical protein
VEANKHRSRKPAPANTRRFTPLKRQAEADGIPYTSARDAHFRGELPVLKIGKNDKHQRWYVEHPDWEQWLESLKTRVTSS